MDRNSLVFTFNGYQYDSKLLRQNPWVLSIKSDALRTAGLVNFLVALCSHDMCMSIAAAHW